MKKENFIKKIFSCVIILALMMQILPLKAIAIENIDETTTEDLSGKFYVITSKQSNKSIDVKDAGRNNGAIIHQWDYVEEANQQWLLEGTEDGYYKIISRETAKAIDIKDNANYNGATIHQWEDVDVNSQLWSFEVDNDGYYKIKSKSTGKCLDVKGISSQNGAVLQLWDDVNGDNQKWKLTEIEADTNISSGNTYKITSKQSNKSLEITKGLTDNGVRLQQWDYNDEDYQKWVFEHVKGDYYKIVNKKSNKVIDVKDLATNNGTMIHQWDYVGKDNQLWRFEKDKDGYYKIKSLQSGKCLDIVAISSENGAKIQLWDDVDGDNQKWQLKCVDIVEPPYEEELGKYPEGYTLDSNKDEDEDGIKNGDETTYGTDPYNRDSDYDKVSDYDEIFVYNTDPLKADTDGDGSDDYTEIQLGLDPLVPNIVENEYTKNINRDDLGVSLDVNGSAKAVSTAYVDKVSDDYLSNTASIVGNVLEFSSQDNINNAKVTLSYNTDEVSEKALNEDELSLFYINEDELKLEKIDSIVNKENHTVEANLEHFSKYVIGDASRIISNLKDIDIVFAIDKSGSMSGNDRYNKRVTVSQSLVSNLSGNYRFGVVTFNSSANPLQMEIYPGDSQYLTSNKDTVNDKLETLKDNAYGGTNIGAAISSATNLFNKDARKIIILLTDGDDNYGYINSAMTLAKSKGVQIYTVGLGDAVNVSLLKNTISKPTSGKYFHADDADQLQKIFDEIGTKVQVPKTDTIYKYWTDHSSYGGDEMVEVNVLADSGFKVNVDGYKTRNYGTRKEPGGHCFGIASTSILNFYDELPQKSTSMSDFEPKYDLSNVDVFKNGKSLYNNIDLSPKPIDPSKVQYESDKEDTDNLKRFTKESRDYLISKGAYITIEKIKNRNNKYQEQYILDINNLDNATGYTNDEKEILKCIEWWQTIQDEYMYGNIIDDAETYLFLKKKLSIDGLSKKLKEGPIELSMRGEDGGHAVVATKLLQNKKTPYKYYLEIYDSNYPYVEGDDDITNNHSYVEITAYRMPHSSPELYFNAVDYIDNKTGWCEYTSYMETDVLKLADFVKSKN